MSAKEVINAILMQENITGSQLAKDIGLNRPQAVYDILNGKVLKVSARMANLIHSAKPMYNIDWLLTGEGEMLNADIPATSIRTEKPNEQIDSLSVINRLIEITAQKDVEIRELRLAYEHLARCFEKLANGETITPADKKRFLYSQRSRKNL